MMIINLNTKTNVKTTSLKFEADLEVQGDIEVQEGFEILEDFEIHYEAAQGVPMLQNHVDDDTSGTVNINLSLVVELFLSFNQCLYIFISPLEIKQ